MIQVIAGKKGSGKTKRIIDMANQASQESKHDIVFIDDDNRSCWLIRKSLSEGIRIAFECFSYGIYQ